MGGQRVACTHFGTTILCPLADAGPTICSAGTIHGQIESGSGAPNDPVRCFITPATLRVFGLGWLSIIFDDTLATRATHSLRTRSRSPSVMSALRLMGVS